MKKKPSVYLSLLSIAFLVLGILSWFLAKDVRHLVAHGENMPSTVIDIPHTVPGFRGGTNYTYTVQTKIGNLTFDSREYHRIGDTIELIVDSKSTERIKGENYILGNIDDGFWTLLSRNTIGYRKEFFPVFMLLVVLSALYLPYAIVGFLKALKIPITAQAVVSENPQKST